MADGADNHPRCSEKVAASPRNQTAAHTMIDLVPVRCACLFLAVVEMTHRELMPQRAAFEKSI